MNLANIVKINFLILGLAFTSYIIYSLQHDGLPQSVSYFLGLPSAGKGNGGGGQDYISWCSTRAKTLILSDKTTVFQKGTRWYKKQGGTEAPIGTIAVEKWFSSHCRLKVKFLPAEGKLASTYNNKLGIEFVNGVIGYFRQRPDQPDAYAWKGKPFHSPNLSTALKNLENIVHN